MGSIRELKRQDGTTRYHAEVRVRGVPPQRSSFRTKAQAKHWIQQMEQEIGEGRRPLAMEARRHTVGDLIDRFTDEVLTRFPHRKKQQSGLLAWWKQRHETLPLDQLTPAVLCRARNELKDQETVRGPCREPATVNRYLAALGSALSIAVREWEWLESSPMKRVTKLRESQGRDRYLSFEEKDRLLEACKKSRNANLYPVVVIALVTGMRYSEIVGLKWEDVDFQRRTLKLRHTKNGDMRVVPMSPEVVGVLQALPTVGNGSQALLFQSSSLFRQGKLVEIRGGFESACRRADIQNFRFHDLRHTAASYLAMSGATQGELMSILGHRSPAMTKRYAHYGQDHLRKLVEKNKLGLHACGAESGVDDSDG